MRAPHPEGDAALRAFFTIVRDLVGGDGDGYRFGGDEVFVSLPRVDSTRACELGERIRAAVEAEFKNRKPPNPTTSIGVATFIDPVDAVTAAKFVDAGARGRPAGPARSS
jgi:GGDEF domain-containing protein